MSEATRGSSTEDDAGRAMPFGRAQEGKVLVERIRQRHAELVQQVLADVQGRVGARALVPAHRPPVDFAADLQLIVDTARPVLLDEEGGRRRDRPLERGDDMIADHPRDERIVSGEDGGDDIGYLPTGDRRIDVVGVVVEGILDDGDLGVRRLLDGLQDGIGAPILDRAGAAGRPEDHRIRTIGARERGARARRRGQRLFGAEAGDRQTGRGRAHAADKRAALYLCGRGHAVSSLVRHATTIKDIFSAGHRSAAPSYVLCVLLSRAPGAPGAALSIATP